MYLARIWFNTLTNNKRAAYLIRNNLNKVINCLKDGSFAAITDEVVIDLSIKCANSFNLATDLALLDIESERVEDQILQLFKALKQQACPDNIVFQLNCNLISDKTIVQIARILNKGFYPKRIKLRVESDNINLSCKDTIESLYRVYASAGNINATLVNQNINNGTAFFNENSHAYQAERIAYRKEEFNHQAQCKVVLLASYDANSLLSKLPQELVKYLLKYILPSRNNIVNTDNLIEKIALSVRVRKHKEQSQDGLLALLKARRKELNSSHANNNFLLSWFGVNKANENEIVLLRQSIQCIHQNGNSKIKDLTIDLLQEYQTKGWYYIPFFNPRSDMYSKLKSFYQTEFGQEFKTTNNVNKIAMSPS